MRHAIIGTAGHVDHGKTTLIKALTGVDADRLRQEKERGMTIDLGFAPIVLPSGQVAGVVDVPGHERFIKNMLAGAHGVDVALLVVAADEGVMPQTQEHLDILQLLGVREGVVAVTKADLAEDDDWLELVVEDVRESLAGTSLADAQVIPVSASTGCGLDELLASMDLAVGRAVLEDEEWGFARLPIDRVFAMPGHGTVVTGTLTAGRVEPGDRLELLPSGSVVRVRQVQVHERVVEEAVRGQRVALNLAGVDRSCIERGMVIAEPKMMEPSSMFDVELTLLESADPIKHGERLHLHIGTAEVLCRARTIGTDQVVPGQQVFAQLELEEEVVATRGDRFIVRTYSPMKTAGGGRVLALSRGRRRRFREETLREFETLSAGDQPAIARFFASRIVSERSAPASFRDVARAMCAEPAHVRDILEEGAAQGWAVAFGDLPDGRSYMPRDDWEQVVAVIARALSQYHNCEPLRAGMAKEELRTRIMPSWDGKAFSMLVARAAEDGLIEERGTAVALPTHVVSLNSEQQRAKERLEAAYLSSLMSPPEAGQALAEGIPQAILDYLIDLGVLVRVGPELLFHRHALVRAAEIAHELGAGGQPFTAAQFRDACGNTRKYAVALLEYLDANRITVRIGDERVLAC
ncbi:MAG: selenocysteine-specific translation elongation factor [Firmicutes bacterium]|jgi:selenocysteine-specific elongation factor|nr:selenocysteine-specific translation elongation factor [Bacillota bacterium]MDD4336866.1 selenocysteine-specific translation elongation factor [Bacillota bacterium]MDD4793211.1 selenocysteine-specific translation elongation factor [Bacillota bacterium]